MDKLYDYFLHFNHYTGYWNAVKRDVANQYLNGTLKEEEVLKSKDVTDLVRFISKSKVKK